MFPDTADKLPEVTDQQPLYVEFTVLRQLPHWSKFSIFNRLEAWFTRKSVVLRNLEAKLLKKENLHGMICGDRAGVRPAGLRWRTILMRTG
jgi:hypothetical protein